LFQERTILTGRVQKLKLLEFVEIVILQILKLVSQTEDLTTKEDNFFG